jgi:Prokaryotic Cytochrome C oxidase subunit IV
MSSYLRGPLVLTWFVLLFATGASWFMGARVESEPGAAHVAMVLAIMLVAVIKVRLVMRTFMELEHAPAWLQHTCDAWLLANAAMIVIYYVRLG